MSKKFIIFFNEKEGSSPIIRTLNNFAEIDILHQNDGGGWEPFDTHNSGSISLKDYRTCMELIFDNNEEYFKKLNRIYSKKSRKSLELACFDKRKSYGLKMRLRPQRNVKIPIIKEYLTWKHKRATIEILKKFGVVAFILVRQDVFRWALSKYHGDGTGKPGHLQFRLATNKIQTSDIPKINIDSQVFGKTLYQCEELIEDKRSLLRELREYGIQAHPLLYEEFCLDKIKFFKMILEILDLKVSKSALEQALAEGSFFKKVHSEDISTFVNNHEEISAKFGERFIKFEVTVHGQNE
jgi:hypothetical protein